jgi:general secretion pathway protein E
MMTIEYPVEYDLAGGGGGTSEHGKSTGLSISQTQVDPKKNVTFATGLRHILRQDPDVIMVGEIRDEETARIAVQASLTGHLVLSTLHTNDAAAAVVRLIDLGVEPFLVASSLAAVLAQRLVRKTHAECRGEGCQLCLGTGYKGRTGVFELLVMDAALRDLVIRRCSAMDIKALAQKQGMVSLRDAGSELVRAGLTTPEEVARVIETLEELET